MFNNRYDLGDLVGGILLTYGLSTFAGVGTSSLYGVSFSDPAFSLDGTAIPISIVAIDLAILVAFGTNTQLTVGGFQNRPVWEKAFAAGTFFVPLAFQFVTPFREWMLGGYASGSAVAALVLVGYIIVGYRRDNDKKHSMSAMHKAIGGS